MRMLLTILAVGSLAAHIAENTSNLLQHVKFQSYNFENILTWDSGPGSTPDTVYSVEYKTYGDSKWLAKEGCQRVTWKSCNLTAETGNLTELYYARVTAVNAGGQTAAMMSHRFSLLQDTTIKPPDVTCIPKVRSVQMVIHPTSTPIHAEDGHQLTLEEIFFQNVLYRLELQINRTYKMHLEGKQREYEFLGLTPDTEFLGNIMICVPNWSKESAPYICRVKTLPDRTWTYSFSGAFLFSMGFLVAVFCYLSYRYVTKPPQPPNSLNVQPVLTFQPLRFVQEHILIPALDFSCPSGLAQSVQYSQVKVCRPREPPGALQLHDLPETTYFGQSDISVLQLHDVPPHQTPSPLSYAPQAGPKVRLPSYTPQTTSEAELPCYTPQTISKVLPPSCAPQATRDSWPASYGVCMEGSGKDSPPVPLSTPKHLRPKGQLQKEVPVRSYIPDGLSLQALTSLAAEEPQEAKSSHQYLGAHTDKVPDLDGEPGMPGYLKGQLPLLSSLQIEGCPMSLPLHTPSPPQSPSGQSPSHWGLLESLVCPKDDEAPVSRTDTKNAEPQAPDLEQSVELESFFRGLALTVQWEA